MIKDKEYYVYKAFGSLMKTAASVATDCPADFAATVATWHPNEIGALIDALEEERRKVNG